MAKGHSGFTSADYWDKVAVAQTLYQEEMQRDAEMRIRRAYERAIKEIERDMATFYEKYAQDNMIDLNIAKQRLLPSEMKGYAELVSEFADRYSKVDYSKLDDAAKQLIDNQSKMIGVTRLDELKTTIRQRIADLGKVENTTVDGLLKDTYKDEYYKNVFNIEKFGGIGVSFTKPSEEALQKVVMRKYLGENFSGRIWNNKDKLIQEVEKLIEQQFTIGTSNRTLSEKLAERMNVGLGQAQRLIRTESNYASGQSRLDAYKEMGVTQYRYVATLDSRTSTICREMDGREFAIEDAKIGINYHPLHPNCRSTTVPVVDDEEYGERIARDDQGKNYMVDAKTTYKEWAAEHADHAYAKKIAKGIIATVGAFGDISKDLDKRTPSEHQTALVERMPSGYVQDNLAQLMNTMPEDIRKLLIKAQELGFNLEIDFEEAKPSHYNPVNNTLRFNHMANDANGFRVAIHEMGHMIDYMIKDYQRAVSGSNVYRSALKNDFDDWMQQFKKHGQKPKEYNFGAGLKLYQTYADDMYRGLQDTFNGISGGKVKAQYGHTNAYWAQSGNMEAEAFANMFQAYAMKDLEPTWAEYEKLLPNAAKEFENMIKYGGSKYD